MLAERRSEAPSGVCERTGEGHDRSVHTATLGEILYVVEKSLAEVGVVEGYGGIGEVGYEN